MRVKLLTSEDTLQGGGELLLGGGGRGITVAGAQNLHKSPSPSDKYKTARHRGRGARAHALPSWIQSRRVIPQCFASTNRYGLI